ncbi:hypothetical protein GCM10022291_02110 [Postechiella marina]|uniref:Secretion system C-terminal sorting domain-containing protein n=1 Tax=Postechiella marina TaxID=943941 RepID=A0ABP8BZA6_9FLAO
MKKITCYFKFCLTLVSFFILNEELKAQSVPFNCDYNAYLFQYNDVYAIDLASGNAYMVAENVTPGSINAAAYNPADGYIWGSLSTPSKTIVRIGKNFETTTFYIDELSTSGRYIGDINSDGIYYLKGGGASYYKIDVDPASANYGKYISTETLSKSMSIHDWAFNAVDGNLYAVEKKTNILYRIDPDTGNVSPLGVVPILSGLNYTFGAVYFDASGRFYVSANQTGTIYVIQNVQDLDGISIIESNLFAFGPSSSSNDGARCPTAPVPQEICDNGIDDDGDGLVDCEDPSCSGYASCPVIQMSTSGANDGGLESNNRLSEQINKRNFIRAKASYKFNAGKAKRVKKSKNYARKSSKTAKGTSSAYELKDFVPLEVINEDYVVESTPSDLLAITNATEVYSVDYMKDDISIASILALKTENGVYEHTKFICDRLLGAKILSVSTIDIHEQSFIKSIIKNAEGGTEYVLSLAIKTVNNDADFSIESHWNIDKYEANVDFYNYQIWANSIDALYNLADELVTLLKVEKTIDAYDNSRPPTVFVKEGKYSNGKLDLQIVNTNRTESVALTAGLRETETSAENSITSIIELNGNYITNVEVETGNLFDIGFRIGDGVATPDDLFLSDGPWGYDDYPASTTVDNYNITPNEGAFDSEDFPVERNVYLKATTSDYVAAYRALTPRFKPVDLTEFDFFKLKAKGTGDLQITFVRESIEAWEDQYKTTLALTETMQSFAIPFDDFTATSGNPLVLDDVVTIVFTMISQSGSVVKEMDLNDISFSKNASLSIEVVDGQSLSTIAAVPNPMTSSASIQFTSTNPEEIELVVYNQLGKVVKTLNYNAVYGKNEIQIEKGDISSGLYFCKITSDNVDYDTLKLLIK